MLTKSILTLVAFFFVTLLVLSFLNGYKIKKEYEQKVKHLEQMVNERDRQIAQLNVDLQLLESKKTQIKTVIRTIEKKYETVREPQTITELKMRFRENGYDKIYVLSIDPVGKSCKFVTSENVTAK